MGRPPLPTPPPLDGAQKKAFAQIMKLWPRTKDHGNPSAEAEIAFARVLKDGYEAEAIVMAVRRYVDHFRGTGFDPKYAPHTRTWLRNKRFTDYLEAETEADPEDATPVTDHPLWGRFSGIIDEASFNSWIAGLKIEVDGDEITVTAPTRFIGARVRTRYAKQIAVAMGAPNARVTVLP